MLKFPVPLAFLVVGALASCQPASGPAIENPAATPVPTPAAASAGAPTPVATATAARAAMARHIQTLPNAALYVPDSARVTDNDATWQVLVPRTDWARRMPNRARFEVNKQTGQVSRQPVK